MLYSNFRIINSLTKDYRVKILIIKTILKIINNNIILILAKMDSSLTNNLMIQIKIINKIIKMLITIISWTRINLKYKAIIICIIINNNREIYKISMDN